jgi:cysteine-rich repeat protein
MEARKGWTAQCLWPVLSILMLLAVCRLSSIALGLDTPTPTATPTPRPCVGDCNQDERVTIDEIVAMVDMALAGVGPACVQAGRNADGAIDVSEIIDAVNAALYGCAWAPPVTPALTPSPADTPPVCGNGKVEPPETCDDANTVNGDGCEHCVTQPGYTCVGEPSYCYILWCPEPNPTCSGPPSARAKTTPTPPRGRRRSG